MDATDKGNIARLINHSVSLYKFYVILMLSFQVEPFLRAFVEKPGSCYSLELSYLLNRRKRRAI